MKNAIFSRDGYCITYGTLLCLTLTLAVSGCSRGSGGSLSTSIPSIDYVTLSNFANASIVVGQSDFTGGLANQGGGADASTLSAPTSSSAVSANNLLFIGDTSNNRVLGYNSMPTLNNAVANLVLGQTDFNSTSVATTQAGMSGPRQVSIGNDKMVVVDNGNNRVLIYNSVPTNGSAMPGEVIGQSNFTASTTGCTDSSMNSPGGAVVTDNGKLIVADTNNHRVLIWDSIPSVNGQAANLVLGQSGFASCTANAGTTPSAKTLNTPVGVWSNGTKLVIADKQNNRVLIWNSFPTSNNQAANLVLGQGDFTHVTPNDDNQDNSTDSNPTARTLSSPAAVSGNGTQLAIADSGNNRVLIWNSVPATSFQNADVVLGQGDFTHDTENDDNQDGAADSNPSARTLNLPSGVLFHSDTLLVTDQNNHRVLIYQSE